MGILSKNRRGKTPQVPDHYEISTLEGKFMGTFDIVEDSPSDEPKGAISVAKQRRLAAEKAEAEMLAKIPLEPIIELDPEEVARAIEYSKNQPVVSRKKSRLELLGIESHFMLTDEQLQMIYPNENLTPIRLRKRFKESRTRTRKNDPTGRYAMTLGQQKYVKEAIKQMNKKISKHILTQEFIEHFHNKIGPELIVETLHSVLIDKEERTENKLKALSELTKYSLIPSQAQEVKVEVDTSYDEDKRARLAELLGKVNKQD